MLNDILIGIVLSLNYLLGFVLYSWSKEEVDYIICKFKPLERLDKLVLPLAVLFGIISAVFIKKIEVLLIILLISTIISSGTIKDKNNIFLPTILFLIAFVIAYFSILFLQK